MNITSPDEWPNAAKTTLTRRVGPLPVYGWALVGGSVILVLIAIRRRQVGSGDASALTVTPAAIAVGGPAYGGGYGGSSPNPVNTGGGVGGGGTPPPVSSGGGIGSGNLGLALPANDPVQSYTREQNLTYLAQIAEVLRTGTFLPNSGPVGLQVVPGTPRHPVSQEDLDTYRRLYADLSNRFGFSQSEIDTELTKLQTSYASGWAYHPGSSNTVVRALASLDEQIVGRLSPTQQGAYTTGQISAINYLGGMTPENMQRILDSGGVAYLDRIAAQQPWLQR